MLLLPRCLVLLHRGSLLCPASSLLPLGHRPRACCRMHRCWSLPLAASAGGLLPERGLQLLLQQLLLSVLLSPGGLLVSRLLLRMSPGSLLWLRRCRLPKPLSLLCLLCLLLLPPVGRSARHGCLWRTVLLSRHLHCTHLLVQLRCMGLQWLLQLRLLLLLLLLRLGGHVQLCLRLHLLRGMLLLLLRLLWAALLGCKPSEVLHLPLPPLHRLLLGSLCLACQLRRRALQLHRLLGVCRPTTRLRLCARRVGCCLLRRRLGHSCCLHSCCFGRCAGWQALQC